MTRASSKEGMMRTPFTGVGTALVTMLVAYGTWWSFSMFYVEILREFGWSRNGPIRALP